MNSHEEPITLLEPTFFYSRSDWDFVGFEFSNTCGIDQPDGLVLLCFQSGRQELCECLLESPMAVQLTVDGMLLQLGCSC